jgi:hypothetical protein
MELPVKFVNHNAPPGPTVISLGPLIPDPRKFVTSPVVVIRPMESLEFLNHSAPSGPATMLKAVSMPVPG